MKIIGLKNVRIIIINLSDIDLTEFMYEVEEIKTQKCIDIYIYAGVCIYLHRYAQGIILFRGNKLERIKGEKIN
jgi:hypothetical protein